MSSNQHCSAFKSIIALCSSEKNQPEEFLVEQLQGIVQLNPPDARERDGDGLTLFHHAAQYRSVAFMKVLLELDGGRAAVMLNKKCGPITFAHLPFNAALDCGNVEMVKYLWSLDPEYMYGDDCEGETYLHSVASGRQYADEVREELTRFLILHDDPDGLKKSDLNNHGDLPLHAACRVDSQYVPVIDLIYNAYPQALFCENDYGDTPLSLVHWPSDFWSYLSSQRRWIDRAQRARHLDTHGQLPIHDILRTKEPKFGTIKLMVSANVESLNIHNAQGYNPLHIACIQGYLDIVKYLIEADANRNPLQIASRHSTHFLPLHLACISGNCHVVNYILEMPNCGVFKYVCGALPLDILLCGLPSCDRDSLEYVEAVFRMLRANPEYYKSNYKDGKLPWCRKMIVKSGIAQWINNVTVRNSYLNY